MKKYTDLCLTNADALAEMVKAENANQLAKWHIQTVTAAEWLMYLVEEVGEMSEAIAENQYRKGQASDVVKEAIQVATLALKVAEMFQFIRQSESEVPENYVMADEIPPADNMMVESLELDNYFSKVSNSPAAIEAWQKIRSTVAGIYR